jgi:hypothetical protein
VSIWLHLSPWKSSSITMPFLKTTSPYFMPNTTYCGRNNLCPTCLFFVLKTRLSNIIFWYRVCVIFTYSLPFSWLFFVSPSKLWQFASKSNCCYKLWVTIRFILLYNPFFFKSVYLWMSSISKNSNSQAIPKSPSTWTTKPNSTRIQNSNP